MLLNFNFPASFFEMERASGSMILNFEVKATTCTLHKIQHPKSPNGQGERLPCFRFDFEVKATTCALPKFQHPKSPNGLGAYIFFVFLILS